MTDRRNRPNVSGIKNVTFCHSKGPFCESIRADSLARFCIFTGSSIFNVGFPTGMITSMPRPLSPCIRTRDRSAQRLYFRYYGTEKSLHIWRLNRSIYVIGIIRIWAYFINLLNHWHYLIYYHNIQPFCIITVENRKVLKKY